MVTIRVPSDVASSAGRAAHELSLAALLGGNLFGRVAMNSALEGVSDEAERGKVLNRAWRRYGTVNSLALIGLVAGWLPARLAKADSRWSSERERRLTTAKDVAVGAVVVTGLASAASGVSFAQQAPDGAVPMQSGRDAAPDATPRAARLKRVVNALGALNLASEVALSVINASLPRTDSRQPLLHRLLRARP
jgi:hypothetical protein